MNLITEPWLSFITCDNKELQLPISAVCRADIVDIAVPRADFKGAAYQFLIGLLQTTFAPASGAEWETRYRNPPAEEKLSKAMLKVSHVFNLTGSGPLFMQDFDELAEAKISNVSTLLIDAPGKNGIENNTDIFVKRGGSELMSIEMAALALFTLQINAPGGGQGHRAGLRGGGPMTTLILPSNDEASLWQRLWLNVMHREFIRYCDPNFNDGSVFPWCVPTRTSEKDTQLFPSDVHWLHLYWSMPRRIRLVVEEGEEICHITGKNTTLFVRDYRKVNYGTNYSGDWKHSLTPYRWNPKKPDKERLPIKGQRGGITYKVWDVLTLSSDNEGQKCADVIEHFYQLGNQFSSALSETPRLWAFAYDMDKMNPRGWYSSSWPLFSISLDLQEEVIDQIRTLQKIASNMLGLSRKYIKSAWFGKPKLVSGDLSFIDLRFWQQTEQCFFIAVTAIVKSCEADDPHLSAEQAQQWLDSMRSVTMKLFDEYALSWHFSERSLRDRVKARLALHALLFSNKDRQIKRFIAENLINTTKEVSS